MAHRVGKRPLQKVFARDASQCCPQLQVPREIRQRLVKVADGVGKRRQHWWTVAAADEERPGVAQDAIHVANEFVGSPNPRRRTEVPEVRWRVSQRLLRSIRNRCEEVSQQPSFSFHVPSSPKGFRPQARGEAIVPRGVPRECPATRELRGFEGW